MWSRYDASVVREELTVLRDHGLTMTRSFLYWPDVMPAPHQLDEDQLAHFGDFLDLHAELGLTTIPTFLVGHMSGENWDPAWRQGRDLYADTWMVAQQAWYIRTVVERWSDHPAVAGWLISNEMPIYGLDAPTDVVTSWAELMVQAVRAGGGTQPVSLGDGAWGIEVTGHDNGFSVRELGALVDFVGPHVYKMETDVVRQHLKSAFICELAAVGGRPVVLEEFGLSSDFASAENSGHYYRQQLHLSLLGGSTGWIAWNNTDYDPLIDQDPYRHHPFELHFGITTADGTPKPPLLELQEFAAGPGRDRRHPVRAAPGPGRAGGLLLPRDRLPAGRRAGPNAGVRCPGAGPHRGAGGRPAAGFRAGDRRDRGRVQAVPRPVDETADRTLVASARRAGRAGGDGLRVLLRRRERLPARSVVDRDRGPVRGAAPARCTAWSTRSRTTWRSCGSNATSGRSRPARR